ncbi:MAG: outer membrane lipoprotein carrier protein LolA [bacterium]|nr:MAG: outer membrane lipoprotein carrier protein LolA [bacterium]
MIKRLLFCFPALVLLCHPSPAPGDTADEALALVRSTYASLKGLKAGFRQTEERPGVGVTSSEDGELFFSPPGLMRWDYQGRRPHRVVINGNRVWIHTPSRRQVVVREMTPQEMRRGAATFLGGLDGVQEDFDVRPGQADAGSGIPLDLIPREENVPYDRISVLVRPETGLIERIAIHHKIGNVTTITFRDIKTGMDLPERLFKWDIPEGTEVIEP